MIESFSRQKTSPPQKNQHGLSLLELTIVLLILMALAGLVLPTFNEVPAYAQCTATKATMKAIRDALLGNASGGGYVADMGHFPISLSALNSSSLPFYCTTAPTITTSAACVTAGGVWQQEDKYNPVTATGWRGPYMQESTILSLENITAGNFDLTVTPATHIDPNPSIGDTGILDSFSHDGGVRRPILIQNPSTTCITAIAALTSAVVTKNDCVRLISAGQNGILETTLADAVGGVVTGTPPTADPVSRGDDLILYLKISDPVSILPKDDQTGCSLTDE